MAHSRLFRSVAFITLTLAALGACGPGPSGGRAVRASRASQSDALCIRPTAGQGRLNFGSEKTLSALIKAAVPKLLSRIT